MSNDETIRQWQGVIEGTFVSGKSIWEIAERIPQRDLQAKLNSFNDEYSGRLVRHVNSGGCYRISHFSVLNANGKAEYAVNYHPYNENLQKDYNKVNHTKPAKEFFDGRFI